MLHRPFRFFVRFACAVRVARCGNADAPKGIGILLPFDHDDGVLGCNGLIHLRQAIEQAGVDAPGVADPSAVAVGEFLRASHDRPSRAWRAIATSTARRIFCVNGLMTSSAMWGDKLPRCWIIAMVRQSAAASTTSRAPQGARSMAAFWKASTRSC